MCFAVGGDSLVSGMDLAPAIAAFFSMLAAAVVGLIACLMAWCRGRARASRLVPGRPGRTSHPG